MVFFYDKPAMAVQSCQSDLVLESNRRYVCAMRKITLFIAGLLLGALLGAGAAWRLSRPGNEAPPREVTVRSISGAEIAHRDFLYDGGAVVFTSEARGAGVARTAIPKENIPEARSWMNLNDGIQADLSLLWYDGAFHRVWGASYLRRYGRVSLGAGVRVSDDVLSGRARGMAAGVTVSAQYWTDL